MSTPQPSLEPTGLEPLLPLIAAKGGKVSPAEFHAEINRVFHSHESAVYDEIHNEMKLTLPLHFNDLVNAFLARHPFDKPIRVLDIGCGTGLSAELLLQTRLGDQIAHFDFLDTSNEMLRRCERRPSLAKLRKKFICGTLDQLESEQVYDVIQTCSVLHHIPDLRGFFRELRNRHRTGAMFLHLQDPNGDFMNDSELRQRTEEFDKQNQTPRWKKRITPQRVLRRLQAAMQGKKPLSYIDRINQDLLASGVIVEPLTDNELWSVTDIHIYDGKGISLGDLASMMPGYELVASRSYSFFGTMYSELGDRFQQEEESLIRKGAPNGLHIAAAWRNAGESNK